MAGRTSPDPLVVFLRCGCPVNQGCECRYYTTGCGACAPCRANAITLGETGVVGTAACKLATGYHRLTIDGFVLAYPAMTLRISGVLRRLKDADWLRQLAWCRVVFGKIVEVLDVERQAHERRLERMQCIMMQAEDTWQAKAIKSTGAVGKKVGGMYLDTDLIHGDKHQAQRVRVDVLLPSIMPAALEERAILLRYEAAIAATQRCWVTVAASHMVRIARGFLGRLRVRRLVAAKLRDMAATLIQAAWRRHYTYTRVWLPALHGHHLQQANNIQRVFRSFAVRRPYMRKRKARRYLQLWLLARQIQALWMGYTTRKVMRPILAKYRRAKAAARAKSGEPPEDIIDYMARAFPLPSNATAITSSPSVVVRGGAAAVGPALHEDDEAALRSELLASPGIDQRTRLAASIASLRQASIAGHAGETPLWETAATFFAAIPLASMTVRIQRDVPLLYISVERQMILYTTMRSGRYGRGKWSRNAASGTTNMARRLRDRPYMLQRYYRPVDPIAAARGGARTSTAGSVPDSESDRGSVSASETSGMTSRAAAGLQALHGMLDRFKDKAATMTGTFNPVPRPSTTPADLNPLAAQRRYRLIFGGPPPRPDPVLPSTLDMSSDVLAGVALRQEGLKSDVVCRITGLAAFRVRSALSRRRRQRTRAISAASSTRAAPASLDGDALAASTRYATLGSPSASFIAVGGAGIASGSDSPRSTRDGLSSRAPSSPRLFTGASRYTMDGLTDAGTGRSFSMMTSRGGVAATVGAGRMLAAGTSSSSARPGTSDSGSTTYSRPNTSGSLGMSARPMTGATGTSLPPLGRAPSAASAMVANTSGGDASGAAPAAIPPDLIDAHWDLIEDAEKEARREADRLAALRIIRPLDPIPDDVDCEELVQARPMPDDYFLTFDEPVVAVIRASGLSADEFMTHPELKRFTARKQLMATFTTPVEEAAATRVAGGLVDSIVEVVAAYMVHLHVSAAKTEEERELLGRTGRSSAASWTVGTALTTPVMSGRTTAVSPVLMGKSIF